MEKKTKLRRNQTMEPLRPLLLGIDIARRAVDLDTRCPLCHRLFEDGRHLFLTCKFAKQRWMALLLEDVRLNLIPCQSAIEMLEEVLNLSEKEKLLSVSLLWNWWQERNRGNHGESYQNVCGDPGLPSGIPVMHTIHDPRRPSLIHITELALQIHHPLHK
jgi:hypothetical protein